MQPHNYKATVSSERHRYGEEWLDKVTNEKVLRRVNEDRQILNSV